MSKNRVNIVICSYFEIETPKFVVKLELGYWFLTSFSMLSGPCKSLKMKVCQKNTKKKHQFVARNVFCHTFATANARIAQLVEHDLAKVGVAGSSPVYRSFFLFYTKVAQMAELVDAPDLKSCVQ